MRVIARYYGFFSSVTRKLSEEVSVNDGLTVKDLVELLVGSYGYKFRSLCYIRPLYSDRDYLNICLNTLDLNSAKKFPDGMDTSLEEGDVVSFGVMGGAA
jgi:molybdopterin converting factor small subunit